MGIFNRSSNPDAGSGGCWSCGTLTRKHGKNCKAKAGKQPGKQTGKARGQSGGFKACGFRWSNPTRPKRGQHFMHTCANAVPEGARDNMCAGPHFCVASGCENPTRSK